MEVNSIHDTNGQYSAAMNRTSLVEISELVIQGVFLSVIGLVGLCGNFASIIHFSRRQRYRKHFEAFVLWLAVSDNVLIISAWLAFAAPVLFENYERDGYSGYLVPWMVPIAQVAITCNIYFTIAISIERHIVICRPFFHRGQHRHISSKTYIIPIFMFSFIYNISKFFELETFYVDSESDGNLIDQNSVSNLQAINFKLELLLC